MKRVLISQSNFARSLYDIAGNKSIDFLESFAILFIKDRKNPKLENSQQKRLVCLHNGLLKTNRINTMISHIYDVTTHFQLIAKK